MKRILITALAAASVGAIATGAQATTVSGDQYAKVFVSSQDCPVTGSQTGFTSCWATQTGVVSGQPANNPTASQVVAKIGYTSDTNTFTTDSSGGGEINSGVYPSVDSGDFQVSLSGGILSFTYTPNDANDPTLHYITLKQAGAAAGGGYELFYDPTGFTANTTYTFTLSKYFTQPGLSHLDVYDGGSPVPEPATWAMMLLGFGGIGATMRRRRKGNNALMQVA